MRTYVLGGERRSKLREAILSGFDDQIELNEFLKDNNRLSHEIADGPNLSARVGSLIDVAFQEGWLIELCTLLAVARSGRQDLVAVFDEIRKWLLDQEAIHEANNPRKLTIVLSSVETDSAWKENFQKKGRFFEAMHPCDWIDTLERLKQSKDNGKSVLREIDDAKLFVGIVSKRYIRFAQTAAEFDRAFKQLPGPDNMPTPRRLLALALDREGRDWLKKKKEENLHAACRDCVIVEEFFDGNNRKSIYSNGATDDAVVEQILRAGETLRAHFDRPADIPPPQQHKEEVREPPSKTAKPAELPARPGTVVILGEPKTASAPEAVTATDDLIQELIGRHVPYERWGDGWRAKTKPVSALSARPVFVRTIVDKAQASAQGAGSRLAAELNVAFGFQFDDESESVRPLLDCPRILWRPNGPDWSPAASGPNLYSSTEKPPDFAQWLTKLLRLEEFTDCAIVHYEDPADGPDIDNSVRRSVVEDSLVQAMTNDELPLKPDSAPFGYDQLLDVINSVSDQGLTVIAAHDLRTPPGSRQATIERFREIDKRIDQTLASKRAENAPLMRVAVLLRNAKLFPALEFSRNSRVRSWQLLRIFKDADGTYKPDAANVQRLREYAADLARRRPEQHAP